MGQHAKFIARTVFVQSNNVEEACRVINKYVPTLIFYINLNVSLQFINTPQFLYFPFKL